MSHDYGLEIVKFWYNLWVPIGYGSTYNKLNVRIKNSISVNHPKVFIHMHKGMHRVFIASSFIIVKH